MRSVLALVVGWLIVAGAWAVELEPAAMDGKRKHKNAPDPETISLHLMDGTVITGRPSVRQIRVETKFGTLNVPIAELVGLVPGLNTHVELRERIADMIAKLGSNRFRERGRAQEALIKMGPSVQEELRRRLNDPDPELRARVQTILDEFDQLGEDEQEPGAPRQDVWIRADRIETTVFTILGEIVQKQFEMKTPYGRLIVQLDDIRRGGRDVPTLKQIRKTFTVSGENLVQRSFKSARIQLKGGERVSIIADGTISMTPWGNSQVSTPEGGSNFGWYRQGEIPGGALVARIGDGGKIFKVGSRYTFTAKRAGALQFAIAMKSSYASHNFPGEYRLRVKVIRK